MVIIDTSAWIDFFLRDGKIEVKLAVKGLLDALEGALCGPVEMEFLGGARPSEMEAIRSWFNITPPHQRSENLTQSRVQLFRDEIGGIHPPLERPTHSHSGPRERRRGLCQRQVFRNYGRALAGPALSTQLQWGL